MTETRTGYCVNCYRTNPESQGTEMATEIEGGWLCNKCNQPVEILPEELKQCPFCGGEGYVCTTNPNAWWVTCDDCGAEGEAGDNLEQGVQYWNRRI